MATRGRGGELKGAVSNRIQAKNPITSKWVKIDTNSGRIIEHKTTPGPYKNIRRK